MVAQVETKINKVEIPQEIHSLIQGLEAHQQVVDELIAILKGHSENQLPLGEIIHNASGKLVRSAYAVQHLANSLSSR